MTTPEPTQIREHLARILSSATFHGAQKTQRFIEFIVTESLKHHRPSEQSIGEELYGQGFRSSKKDNRVRQLARTARKKLDAFYRREGVAELVRINLELFNYRPTFELRQASAARQSRLRPVSSSTVPYREFDLEACYQYVCRQPSGTASVLEAALANIDLFDPPAEGQPCPCLATVLRINNFHILLVPSRSSFPDAEGPGRTSLLTHLLGVSFAYDTLMALETAALPSEIRPRVSSQTQCLLIASDTAYVDIVDGQLTARPLKAEALNFVWDLARHLFRATTPHYETGGHRVPGGDRNRLFQLFFRIPFQSLEKLLAPSSSESSATVRVDHIIILRQEFPGPEQSPQPRLLSDQSAVAELRSALTVGATHNSPYWKRRTRALEIQADMLLRDRLAHPLPPVSEVLISRPHRLHSRYVFEDLARHLLSMFAEDGPTHDTRLHSDLLQMHGFRGIRQHNDLLITGIRDATHSLRIDLLLTSGQKLFSEAAFWAALLESRVDVQLTVLFLEPHSPATTSRESTTYGDKGPGFLEREILDNVDTLHRLTEYLRLREAPVRVIHGFYRQAPLFKFTFIGDGRLLVAKYGRHERTGSQTLFFDLRARESGDLYDALRSEYLRIRGTVRLQEF